MYILSAIVRSWGEFDIELRNLKEKIKTNVATDILGRIWFRGEPTIDKVGEDHVNGAVGQDEDRLTRFIHLATQGTKYSMSGAFNPSQL